MKDKTLSFTVNIFRCVPLEFSQAKTKMVLSDTDVILFGAKITNT